MSREIKFRAWDKEGLCFLKPIETTQLVIRPISGKITDGAVDVSEKIELLQYTGNNDKKDVEIYENDIVEDEYNRKYVVVFKGDCWRCEPLSKGLKNRWISNHLMVIGNVYSSPELLEEITK